jgi:hypothetical protein
MLHLEYIQIKEMKYQTMPNQEEITEVLNHQETMLQRVATIEVIPLKLILLQEKCQVREAMLEVEIKAVPEEMAEETEEVRLNKYRF